MLRGRSFDYTCNICAYRRTLTRIENSQAKYKLISDDLFSSLKVVKDARDKIVPLYLKLYNNCISSHQFPLANYQRGLIHFQNGNFIAAWDDIQEFFEKYALSGETDQLPISTIFDKGLIESELGLYNNAIASLSQVIEHDPSNKMAYFERAAAYFEIGNFDAAFSDFITANLQNTNTQISDLEYATAVLSGIKRGLLEGAKEFLPSLVSSFKGMSTALWSAAVDDTTGAQALVSNPSSFFNLFVSLLQQHVRDLSQKATEVAETYSLSDAVVELEQFYQDLVTKDPSELGEQTGFIIGKYGTEALAWYGVLKLPKALNFANKGLTFEIGAESAAAREAIISQAIKKQAPKELISAKSCAHRLFNAEMALIPEEKLTKYALDLTSLKGKDKAIAFENLLGFNQKNYKELMTKIKEGVKVNTPVFKEVNKYGASFQVDMAIEGPKGKALVRTGWIYDPESTIPRLTSVYPKKRI